MRALVIEDEPKTAEYLRKGLSESGFGVDVALDGEEGVFLAHEGDYDVIILDVMLPERDGWSVLRQLRCASTFPTARACRLQHCNPSERIFSSAAGYPPPAAASLAGAPFAP